MFEITIIRECYPLCWDEYPGKGIVLDVFVEKNDPPFSKGDQILADNERLTVKEIVLYCERKTDTMVGLVTEELQEATYVNFENQPGESEELPLNSPRSIGISSSWSYSSCGKSVQQAKLTVNSKGCRTSTREDISWVGELEASFRKGIK